MGKLGDLEEVAGGAAHELAGAVLVIKGEGQALHVAEEVPADVRLDAHAHHVAHVGDDVLHHRPQGVGGQEGGHHGEEGAVEVLGQQVVEAPAGDIGKGQVYQGDAHGAAHIQDEQAQVGPIIRQEDGQVPTLKTLRFHSAYRLLSKDGKRPAAMRPQIP